MHVERGQKNADLQPGPGGSAFGLRRSREQNPAVGGRNDDARGLRRLPGRITKEQADDDAQTAEKQGRKRQPGDQADQGRNEREADER